MFLTAGQGARVGPQSARQTAAPAVPGGVDFSQATRQPDGRSSVLNFGLFWGDVLKVGHVWSDVNTFGLVWSDRIK